MRNFLIILSLLTILTVPSFASESTNNPNNEIWLSFHHAEVNQNGICALVYQDTNGNLERFEYWDELGNIKDYFGSVVVWDKVDNMMAVYQYEGDFNFTCSYSDWD